MELPFLVVVCWGFVAGDNSSFNLEQHMNERDRELADQVKWTVDLTYGDLKTFADLIRADEREACAKMCAALMESPELIGDCHVCVDAIRARRNT